MYTLCISLLIIAEIFVYYTFGSRMKWYYTQGYTTKIIVCNNQVIWYYCCLWSLIFCISCSIKKSGLLGFVSSSTTYKFRVHIDNFSIIFWICYLLFPWPQTYFRQYFVRVENLQIFETSQLRPKWNFSKF